MSDCNTDSRDCKHPSFPLRNTWCRQPAFLHTTAHSRVCMRWSRRRTSHIWLWHTVHWHPVNQQGSVECDETWPPNGLNPPMRSAIVHQPSSALAYFGFNPRMKRPLPLSAMIFYWCHAIKPWHASQKYFLRSHKEKLNNLTRTSVKLFPVKLWCFRYFYSQI